MGRQHGVVARAQLSGFGFSRQEIEHRVRRGRLHPVHRGVYVVGRRELSQKGRWMAAVLACGPSAALSHESAAALWGFARGRDRIEISVVGTQRLAGTGIVVHRRRNLQAQDRTRLDGVPVTGVVRTLVDLAGRRFPGNLERYLNEADVLDLIDPERLRAELGRFRGQRGVARIRARLDADTYRLSESELERRFMAIVRPTPLPLPLTQCEIVGGRADFHWPEIGLVVEADSLRYHRTPSRQSSDARRDQRRTAAGLRTLRFTHWQIRHEPAHVRRILLEVTALMDDQKRSDLTMPRPG